MNSSQYTPHPFPLLGPACIALALAGCSGAAGPEQMSAAPMGSGSNMQAGGSQNFGTAAPGGTTMQGMNAATGSSTQAAGGAASNPEALPSSGGASAIPESDVACSGADQAASKRIVRLSFNQLANSIGTLIDTSLTPQLAADNAILDSKNRAFPPLQSPREGGIVTDGQWTTIDAMASEAGEYVYNNFDAITGCGAQPTDTCAQNYLMTLAEQAYRRPLVEAEQTRILELYAELMMTDGASITQAVQYGVYAILQAPQFVYRTELGEDWSMDGALTQYELASALSFFLTDDMPDRALLDAAASGSLATADGIASQVERILSTDAAKQNLQDAMTSYFNYQALQNVVVQDPAYTDGVSASMYHEGELFLENTLWNGELNDLLLSRQSVVNDSLAEIYGISPFPQPGTTVDQDGFAPVELPENRSGILTMPGFLTTRSRPTSTSVVGRGLLIKNAFLCTDTPPPPEAIGDLIAQLSEEQADETEREKSIYRQTTSPCNACHASFDPYGLAIENYDLIGRFRDTDPEGRPIDTSVTLPAQIGGDSAANIVEVAQKIAETGTFAKCMGRNLINYALADTSTGSAEIDSCSTQRVAELYAASPTQDFSALIKSVAVAAPFSTRTKGADQ